MKTMKSSKIKAILYPTAPMKTMIHMKTKPAPKKPAPKKPAPMQRIASPPGPDKMDRGTSGKMEQGAPDKMDCCEDCPNHQVSSVRMKS